LLWAKFGRGGVSSGAMFGFLIGLLVHAGTLFSLRLDADQRPESRRVGSSPACVQATVLGALVAAIYKADASR
jgi:hypothetical protein